MKYKLVIFDFDGTLADSFPWFLRMVNTVAAKYQFKRVEEEEVQALRSLSALQLVRHLGIPLWKMPMIAHHVRQLMMKEQKEIACFEGVDQLLSQLSEAGVLLALVTSNSYANVREVLGADNLALMTYIECDVSLFGKRSRYRKILKQSGVRPMEALCIGDEIRDIEAATQELIPFGAVSWGYTHIEALQARSPAEVFARVDEIAGRIIESA
ncbi:MAG: HAD hydrolase-like protein [Caldilineaceae bacterium]|nr:HAD hydrolase-like protein [Caldilineaceae bacterium]